MLMFKKEKGKAIPIEARNEMITIYQGTMEISSPIGEKTKEKIIGIMLLMSLLF